MSAFLFPDGEYQGGGVIIKHTIILLTLIYTVLVTLPARADDFPRWSLWFKGGYFAPSSDQWKANYGSSGNIEWSGQLGFKISRRWELGIEGGYFSDSGTALTASGQTTIYNQKIKLFPLQAYLLYRLIFNEDQFFVPFAGGGYSHFFYRQSLENQETVKGSQDGYHVRMGLQLLLDWFDPAAADSFDADLGVKNSYLVLEVQYSKVDDFGSESIDLGGWSYLGGLLFEF